MKRPLLIAEVKTRSPFGFESKRSWEELFAMARELGDWIAVHTDPRWGGSLERIAQARKLAPEKMLLAKGIHASDSEAMAARCAGADRVLVVGRKPRWPDVCVWEPETLADLAALKDTSQIVVWNQRDLATGQPKVETFAQARKAYAGPLCQASYLRSWDDVDFDADAVLVGEALPEWHRKGGMS